MDVWNGVFVNIWEGKEVKGCTDSIGIKQDLGNNQNGIETTQRNAVIA